MRILQDLPSSFPLPILAVLHISSPFGAAMADWLNDWHQCEWPQFEVVIQAAIAGHGVALGWRPLVDAMLRDGQLVTLPVPFLDTACPAGWLDALREVVAVPVLHIAPARPH